MFEHLPEKFRAYNLNADIRVLLLLRKSMERGLIRTLGDTYNVLKGIIVKDPRMLGPFTRAFYDYFLNIQIRPGESLNDAIMRSDTFRQWRDDNLDRFGDDADTEDIVQQFLDDVHLTTYDIKEVLDGQEIWDKDSGDKVDTDDPDHDGLPGERVLRKMADYSGLSLEELLERMREVQNHQRTRYGGGSHWIGTGGISPYGHGGAAKDGIRVGGTGGGKMARKVLNDRKYFPVDMDAILTDNNIDAALSSLKGVVEESAHSELDIPDTIDRGIKMGGVFLPRMRQIEDEQLRVLLFIDNGGYSMDPYVGIVQKLFRKMKTRFAHDMETYYFHNTIYDRVYTDYTRRKPVPIDKILSKAPDYRIFIIGDAAMAPYELNKTSLDTYRNMKRHFHRVAWLTPEPEKYWHHTFTIQVIRQLVHMYPLSPKGIEKAVTDMNRKKKLL